MSKHLMLVPSLTCPAACSYCFGPHEGGHFMRPETIEAIVGWQKTFGDQDTLEITFHGGEPLIPGVKFYRMALPFLKEGLAPHRIRFAMQSNLWLLTDELIHLFREYQVSLGTSLDGPEAITDAQRGKGYFHKTMAGIERARSQGLDVGCICTFTRRSVSLSQEIFGFFLHEGLNFTLHSAVPSLHSPSRDDWSLSAEEHGELLVSMLERYLANLRSIRINTLDSMCRSISAGHGGICTFGECLGDYLAVGPDGGIYPCQRFTGISEFEMGNVHEDPSSEVLSGSPVWRIFRERQERIKEECGDCAQLAFCRGGCPYNVLATGGGSFNGTLRDPHCPAYKRFFSYVADRALQEVFSQENMDEVINRPNQMMGLLRQGRLLSLMRDGPHPSESARHAHQILAAVALAATGSPAEAAGKLDRLHLVSNIERTRAAIRVLHERLQAPPRGLNNIYLHVTFACNLHCTHCYARAGPRRKGTLPAPDLAAVCRQAARLGFRHAVITGGEPLIHPERDALLDALFDLRREIKPLLTVLRTSLALPMDNDLFHRLSCSTDQVVVSLDGDREAHDARRGSGTYDLTVSNLRTLVALPGDTDISLATVLPLEQANGASGESVRDLAKELGIRRTRFRPLLPLGRAADSEMEIVPETLWGHLSPNDIVAYGFTPTTSCGMGQNLYVEPDGSAYPCYAWHNKGWEVGDITMPSGLPGLISSKAFCELSRHTVNTNRACRACALRYLCGGACRAWSRQPAQYQIDLDAPPLDCTPLYTRARLLLLSAMGQLEISEEQWEAVGLPLPTEPPRLISLL